MSDTRKKCKDCRYGCAEGDCDKPRNSDDMSVQMGFTLSLVMIIGFVIVVNYMVVTTKLELGGVHKLTPNYFEAYNCRPPEQKE